MIHMYVENSIRRGKIITNTPYFIEDWSLLNNEHDFFLGNKICGSSSNSEFWSRYVSTCTCGVSEIWNYTNITIPWAPLSYYHHFYISTYFNTTTHFLCVYNFASIFMPNRIWILITVSHKIIVKVDIIRFCRPILLWLIIYQSILHNHSNLILFIFSPHKTSSLIYGLT